MKLSLAPDRMIGLSTQGLRRTCLHFSIAMGRRGALSEAEGISWVWDTTQLIPNCRYYGTVFYSGIGTISRCSQ